MPAENSVFNIHEADRQLFVYGRNRQFAGLTPSAIDTEMQLPRSSSTLHIHCLTQDGLEYFAERYGPSYRVLYLDDCRLIHDFSPLGALVNLEALRIDNCRMAGRLWDFSQNHSLKVLSILSAPKLVYNPALLQTSPCLEEIRLWGGGFDNRHALKSLDCFRGMNSLRRIDLNFIKLEERSTEVLSTLPSLEEFHFDASMLSTDEIAWICAKYPHLYGDCLKAYTTNDAGCLASVRICGQRKPGLNLPKDQARLDRYIAQFDALVRKYANNP